MTFQVTVNYTCRPTADTYRELLSEVRAFIQCLKKVPTFKLSVTLSNLNRFLKFLHYWKAHEICYKRTSTVRASP